MATKFSSRRLECQGPCDEYGDPLPDGVARVGFIYRTACGSDHIVLDYQEAMMLANELNKAVDTIKNNRREKIST